MTQLVNYTDLVFSFLVQVITVTIKGINKETIDCKMADIIDTMFCFCYIPKTVVYIYF